jgi:DNA-binding transcriptional LysR family regulator
LDLSSCYFLKRSKIDISQTVKFDRSRSDQEGMTSSRRIRLWALQHPFARRRAIPITEVAAEPLIGLTREDYPDYYDYLSVIFSKLKQKPRVVEEHDSFSGILSAVEAGTGVAIGVNLFGYSFGNRVKLLPITPEPKPISVGIAGAKGRLSPAAEKFW